MSKVENAILDSAERFNALAGTLREVRRTMPMTPSCILAYNDLLLDYTKKLLALAIVS